MNKGGQDAKRFFSIRRRTRHIGAYRTKSRRRPVLQLRMCVVLWISRCPSGYAVCAGTTSVARSLTLRLRGTTNSASMGLYNLGACLCDYAAVRHPAARHAVLSTRVRLSAAGSVWFSQIAIARLRPGERRRSHARTGLDQRRAIRVRPVSRRKRRPQLLGTSSMLVTQFNT